MAPSLPLDVLITIIDLDKEDATALKAWTLVSRHLLPFARSHLFRTIDMRKYRGIAGERLFVRLYHFISTNPHIGPFVRNLHFFEVDALHPYMTLSCEHRDFPRLLKLLPELQCFGLYFKEITSWQDRSRGFVKAMEELGQRPTFRELRLSGVIRVPVSILNHCTSLKRLCLRDVTLIHPLNSIRFDLKPRKNQKLAPYPDSTLPEVSLIYLEDASFSGADLHIFQWSSPLSLINFSKLRSLEVDFDIEDFDDVWEAIHSVQKSLSSLKLGQTRRGLGHSIYRSESFLNSDFTPPVPPIEEIHPDFATLSPLTNLIHLSIVISFPNTKRHVICDRIVSEWSTLLQTAHKSLQSISITLDFSFFAKKELKTVLSSRVDRFRSDLKGKGNPNILACLDEQLASPVLFPVLTNVGITVRRPNADVGPWPKFTIAQQDSESSLDSDGDYPARRSRRPMKSEILKISIISMMKLTRKRLETMVASNSCNFVVSVN